MRNDQKEALRRRAEKWLTEKPRETMPATEAAKLLDELRIHEVELVLQNEELREPQAEVEKSRKLYQDLWELSPLGYLTVDGAGRITAINRAGQRLFGRPEHDLVRERFPTLVDPEDQVAVHLLIERAFASGISEKRDITLNNPDGSIRTCQLVCKALQGESGSELIQVGLTDITGHKQAEQALRKNEERLRLALEGGGLGTWDHDLKTGGTVWSPLLFELLGRSPNGPPSTGETFFEYIHKDDRPRVRENIEKTFRTGTDFIDEFRITRDDGEIRWLASFGRLYRDPAGQPIRITGVNFDITDRKEMEEALCRSHNELELRVQERTVELEKRNKEQQRMNRQLDAEIERRRKYEADLKAQGNRLADAYQQRVYLAGRLVHLLERERRQMGDALHDQIGQALTVISMQLQRLKTFRLEDGSTLEELAEPLEAALRDAIKQTRDISHSLRSDVLERFGLIPAVREMVEKIQNQSDIDIHLFAKNIPEKLRKGGKDLVIYRIIQESLTNILKHAGAKRVFITLNRRADDVLVSIEDDGVGFDYDTLSKSGDEKPGSLGITIMRERVSQVGGQFRVESQPGKGTQILAEIPVGSNSDQAENDTDDQTMESNSIAP